MELGDAIATALTKLGVTPDRVTEWLGKPCGCEERKQKLNQLSVWAKRVLKGKTDHAKKYLEGILK